MKVKELIEELKKFDENIEVVYDYDGHYSTASISEISIGNEYYQDDGKEVVILF